MPKLAFFYWLIQIRSTHSVEWHELEQIILQITNNILFCSITSINKVCHVFWLKTQLISINFHEKRAKIHWWAHFICSVKYFFFAFKDFRTLNLPFNNARMLYLVAFVVKILVSTCIKQQRLWGIKSAIRFSHRF